MKTPWRISEGILASTAGGTSEEIPRKICCTVYEEPSTQKILTRKNICKTDDLFVGSFDILLRRRTGEQSTCVHG